MHPFSFGAALQAENAHDYSQAHEHESQPLSLGVLPDEDDHDRDCNQAHEHECVPFLLYQHANSRKSEGQSLLKKHRWLQQHPKDDMPKVILLAALSLNFYWKVWEALKLDRELGLISYSLN